ncbi:hypothetical protein ACU635_54865 [[Actinomadura] parvosata]
MPDPVADGARATARRLDLTADVEPALRAAAPTSTWTRSPWPP